MSQATGRASKTGWLHTSRPPWRLAAGTLPVLLLCMAGSRPADGGAGLPVRSQLLARLGAVRPVEGRLGGFPYGSLSNQGPLAVHWRELSGIVLRIESAAEHRPSPGALADLAAVRLLAGRPAAAVAALRAAIAVRPANAEVQSDLAAALLAVAAATGDPRSLLAALGAADRAVGLAPALPAARFNRALTLEKLQLRAQSRAAWLDYLRCDPSSGWAAEAHRRLDAVTPPSHLASWRAALGQAQSAVLAGDGRTVARLAAAFPQECRIEVQDHLLPAWGSASAGGDTSGASRALYLARALGAALRRGGGDAMGVRSLEAIDRAAESPARRRHLWQGEQAYGAGLQRYGREQYRAARAAFAAAAVQLRAGGSPAALWAEVYMALCDYNQPDYARAGARLAAVAALLPPDVPGLRGRVLWLRGLIALVQGSYGESLSDYRAALATFSDLHETENAGTIHVLLAENLLLLGEHAQAWQHRLTGLRMEAAAESPHLQTALQEAAASCLTEDDPAAAGRFEGEAIQVALRSGDPHLISEAYLRQIPIAVHQNDRGGLAAAQAAVQRYTAAIPDRDLRQRLRADAIASASTALLATDPRRAIGDLTEALEYYDSRRFSLPRAALLRERAQAHLLLAEPLPAAADVAASLGEVERQAARLRDPSQRLRMNAQALPILRDLALLDWQLHRDPWTALADIERARSYAALLPAAPPVQLRAFGRRLPATTALLQYAVLGDRLLVLSLTSEGLQCSEQPVGAAALTERLRRLAAALLAHRRAPLRQSLADLYDILIERAPRAALDRPCLIIVPDDLLLGVPFAALLDRRSRRHLLQDHTVMLAPSASSLLPRRPPAMRMTPLHSGAPLYTRLLIAGDPAFDRELFADLASLPASRDEVRQLAALYEESTMLTGQDANPANLMAALPACNVAHLSAHAVDLADTAFLVLSPQRLAANTQDGTLSAVQILRLDLRTLHLVVLATCGKARPLGQGWSLSRAFLAAGAAGVVESLWPVDDAETAALLLDFHRRLRAGTPPVQALRQAQLNRLAADPASSSLDWAAHQLIGTALPLLDRKGER